MENEVLYDLFNAPRIYNMRQLIEAVESAFVGVISPGRDKAFVEVTEYPLCSCVRLRSQCADKVRAIYDGFLPDRKGYVTFAALDFIRYDGVWMLDTTECLFTDIQKRAVHQYLSAVSMWYKVKE